jgi:hypothetical protein
MAKTQSRDVLILSETKVSFGCPKACKTYTDFVPPSPEEESRLRYFKTDFFHVARCKMSMFAQGSPAVELEVDALTFISSHEVSVFRGMNNMPIADQPGAVGSARKPDNTPKPIRKPFVPPKIKATTAIAVGGTLTDSTSSTSIPVNKEGVWWKKDTKPALTVGESSRTLTLPEHSTPMEPSDGEIDALQSRDATGDGIDTSYHGASSNATAKMNPSATTAATVHEPDDFTSPPSDAANTQSASDKGKGKMRADSSPDSKQQQGARRRYLGPAVPSATAHSSRFSPSDGLRAMYATARAPPPLSAPVFDEDSVIGCSQDATGTDTASAENACADPGEDPFENPDISINF